MLDQIKSTVVHVSVPVDTLMLRKMRRDQHVFKDTIKTAVVLALLSTKHSATYCVHIRFTGKSRQPEIEIRSFSFAEMFGVSESVEGFKEKKADMLSLVKGSLSHHLTSYDSALSSDWIQRLSLSVAILRSNAEK